MATKVLLPQWGMNMQDGTLLKWLKHEGEAVEKGEPLVEIETAKINSELESPASGILVRIAVIEGSTVNVGTVLAVIADPGEEVELEPIAEQIRVSPDTEPHLPRVTDSQAPGLEVVPAARRLATQEGIDLTLVRGSGPGGRILLEDVKTSLTKTQEPASFPSGIKGPRRVIAERMVQSVSTMAQVTLITEIDVTDMVSQRRKLVADWRSHRLRPMDLDLVVSAVAKALTEHREFNATIVDDEIRIHDDVDIGVAIASEQGLIVPVVRGVDKIELLEIARHLRQIAKKAKDGELTPSDVSGASFTITSLASFDIDGFTPIIDPPQVAILGVGRVNEKPVVFGGDIVKRFMMHLSLTFDHRAVDGAPAAQFLQRIATSLNIVS